MRLRRRRGEPEPEEAAEDAALQEIRALLQRATTPTSATTVRLDGVIWFCVCEAFIDEMPMFVIVDGVAAGTSAWQELPDDRDVADVSDEDLPAFGGHVNPSACVTA